MIARSWTLRAWIPVCTLVAAALVLILPPGNGRQLVTFAYLWLWPAVTWSLLLRRPLLARVAVASSLVILINVAIALLLAEVPGRMYQPVLLLVTAVTASVPTLWLTEDGGKTGRDFGWTRRELALVALIIGIGIALRLPNVGYKEFQGDEGVVMVRAAATITGDDAELFLHQKGPVEILVPLLEWLVGSATNEFWARIPFTWAGIIGIVALMALTRQWFGKTAAFWAGILFAVSGLNVAFSRIVQYQNLVVLWTTVSLLSAAHYRLRHRRRDLILALTFFAGALLAHYDAILFAPALAVILLHGLSRTRRDVGAWLWAISLAGALLAMFYVPFLLSPSFASTGSYLLADRIGGNLLSWSVPEVWRMLTFYSSTYYVVGLGLLTAAGIYSLKGQRKTDAAAALLLFLVPTTFYTFVVEDPRTHVYTLMTGVIILAALGITAVGDQLERRWAQYAALATAIAFIAISGYYVYLMFVDTTPERQRNWAQERPPLFVTTWQDPPAYGLFGFPHQAGWRAAAALQLDQPYASNEEKEITQWYMAQAARTHCADYESFLLAAGAQDAIPFDESALTEDQLRYEIQVNHVETLRVYAEGFAGKASTLKVDSVTLWRTPEQVEPPQYTGQNQVESNLSDRMTLRGYDIDTSGIDSQRELIVTLYWEALAPFDRNYQTFVHLYDGVMIAQHDGAPECGVNPTTRWEPGQIIRDAHVIDLPATLPEGPTPILVGAYDLLTKERLLLADGTNDLIHLTEIDLTHFD